jgi:hypothetical protein
MTVKVKKQKYSIRSQNTKVVIVMNILFYINYSLNYHVLQVQCTVSNSCDTVHIAFL